MTSYCNDNKTLCSDAPRLDIFFTAGTIDTITVPTTLSTTPTEILLTGPSAPVTPTTPTSPTVNSIVSTPQAYKALESASIFNPFRGLYGAIYAAPTSSSGTTSSPSVFLTNANIYIADASATSVSLGVTGVSLYITTNGPTVSVPVGAPIIFIAGNNACPTRGQPCIFFNYSDPTSIGGGIGPTPGITSQPAMLAVPAGSLGVVTQVAVIINPTLTTADLLYLSNINACESVTFSVFVPSIIKSGGKVAVGNNGAGLPNTRDTNYLGDVKIYASRTGAAARLTIVSADKHPILIPSNAMFVSKCCGCDIQSVTFTGAGVI